MPQQDDEATELEEAQEVLCFALPASHQSSELFEPREESLNLPSTTVAPHSAGVASSTAASADRSNELDSAFLAKALRQRAAVEALVPDEVRGEVFDERFVERLLYEGDVMSRTIPDANGDRKTIAVCNRHDFRRAAGTATPDTRSPFLAPA
jgi:hypothetical protein